MLWVEWHRFESSNVTWLNVLRKNKILAQQNFACIFLQTEIGIVHRISQPIKTCLSWFKTYHNDFQKRSFNAQFCNGVINRNETHEPIISIDRAFYEDEWCAILVCGIYTTKVKKELSGARFKFCAPLFEKYNWMSRWRQHALRIRNVENVNWNIPYLAMLRWIAKKRQNRLLPL